MSKRDDGRTILKALADTVRYLCGDNGDREREADFVRQSVVHARDALDRQEAVIRGLRRAVKVLAYKRWDGDYFSNSTEYEDAMMRMLEPEVDKILAAGKRGDYRKRPF